MVLCRMGKSDISRILSELRKLQPVSAQVFLLMARIYHG